MARSNDPWQQVGMVAGLAALVGAGAGASSALVFAERRAGAQDREIESLERRVTMLERLGDRVTKLESGPSSPATRRQTG
jgi:hypothetical protein